MRRPIRPCLEPRCPNLTSESRCADHAREHEVARRLRTDATGRRSDTPQWRKARKAAKARDGYHCQLCWGRDELEVHHINRIRGDDRLENLITLCEGCHRDLHGRTCPN